MSGRKVFFMRSWATALEITRSRPAAVESAAANAPAATRPTTQAGSSAISGMLAGLGLTAGYIIYFKFVAPEMNTAEHWFLGISPEGVGTLGMVVNFAVAYLVAAATPPPSAECIALVERVRRP